MIVIASIRIFIDDVRNEATLLRPLSSPVYPINNGYRTLYKNLRKYLTMTMNCFRKLL